MAQKTSPVDHPGGTLIDQSKNAIMVMFNIYLTIYKV